jgi:hypothetical protein
MKFRACIQLATLAIAASVAVQASAAPHSVLLRADKAAPAKGEKAKGSKKGGKEAKASEGQLTKKVAMPPKDLQFGMSVEQVARVYDKVFDKEFLPLYKKAEPGSQMAALDAELRDKKALIRRNRIDFGNDPTGVDYSALKGEYSYGNGEAMSKVTLRSGATRNFFFINNRLWKVYDEHKLGKGSSLGENFEQAVDNLGKKLGAPPKAVEADFAKGRAFDEAQWQDATMLIRAVNRGQGTVGIIYVDRSVNDSLSQLRTNKGKDPHELDRDVKAVTANPPQQPGPPPDEKDKGKDAKGKKKGDAR